LFFLETMDDFKQLVHASAAAGGVGKSSGSSSTSGNVMFSTDAPQIIEHTSKSLDFTPFDCRWVPLSPRFVVLGTKPKGTGVVNMYELTASGITLVREIERPTGIKCGTFGASALEDRHLAVGDFGGDLSILDFDKPSTPVWKAKAHNTIVNCMDGCGGLGIGGGAPELVTGSRDGCVKVWDQRLATPVAELKPAEGQAGRDVWTVAFGNSFTDEERCVVAGYDNGDVKLFDLRTMSMRWEGNMGNGVVSAEFVSVAWRARG
jgi:WD40 repeat protein